MSRGGSNKKKLLSDREFSLVGDLPTTLSASYLTGTDNPSPCHLTGPEDPSPIEMTGLSTHHPFR